MTNEEVIEYVKTLDWYRKTTQQDPNCLIFLGGSRGRQSQNFVKEDSDYDIIVYHHWDSEIQHRKEFIDKIDNCVIHSLEHSVESFYRILSNYINSVYSIWTTIGLTEIFEPTKILYGNIDNDICYSFIWHNKETFLKLGCYNYLTLSDDEIFVLDTNIFIEIEPKRRGYYLQCYEMLTKKLLPLNFINLLRNTNIILNSNEKKILQDILTTLQNFKVNFNIYDYIYFFYEFETILNYKKEGKNGGNY